MKLIISGRGAGKTTELVRRSAETGYYIVTVNRQAALSVTYIARDLGLKIPFPLTAQEFIQGKYDSGVRGVLIDDADDLLRSFSRVPVFAATMSADNQGMEERVHHPSVKYWGRGEYESSTENKKEFLEYLDRQSLQNLVLKLVENIVIDQPINVCWHREEKASKTNVPDMREVVYYLEVKQAQDMYEYHISQKDPAAVESRKNLPAFQRLKKHIKEFIKGN